MFSGPHITTWMRNELLKETYQSVASWEGTPGTFLTKTFSFIKAHNAILLVVKGNLGFYSTSTDNIIFNITGQCDTADRVRRNAHLNHNKDYNQHMTAGLLKHCKLPKVITSYLKEEWKKRLASDWLNINFFCGMKVKADIIDNKLESWKIHMISWGTKVIVSILFSEYDRRITSIDSKGNCSLEKVALVELKKNCSIFDSVLKIISIM